MCLEKQTKRKRITEGYKVFKKTWSGHLKSLYQSPKIIEENKWLNELSFRDKKCYDVIYDETDRPYKKGFHVYDNLKDAQDMRRDLRSVNLCNLVIKKVKVFMIVAQGIQVNHADVTVCKSMKVLLSPDGQYD
jgi:hypothetical protein